MLIKPSESLETFCIAFRTDIDGCRFDEIYALLDEHYLVVDSDRFSITAEMHKSMLITLDLHSDPVVQSITALRTVSSFSLDSLADLAESEQRSRVHDRSISRGRSPTVREERKSHHSA